MHIAYLEHFGITEDGKNFLYDKEELEAYKKAINDKVLLHRKHGFYEQSILYLEHSCIRKVFPINDKVPELLLYLFVFPTAEVFRTIWKKALCSMVLR